MSPGSAACQVVGSEEVLLDSDVYLCGPSAFMQQFYSQLRTAGLPPSRIAYEYFGKTAAVNSGATSYQSLTLLLVYYI